jgi:hypothetical protein
MKSRSFGQRRWPPQAVAAATDVSIRSVRRIEHEPPITTSETATLIAARQIGPPSIAAP